MQAGSSTFVRGFVTQLKYLNGETLSKIEALLGFQAGRLADGATFIALERLPTADEFENRGYSQVADHRHQPLKGYDPEGLKRLAMSVWRPVGGDSLIRVQATTPHNALIENDVQYPPGLGVPQWKVTKPILGRVVAVLQGRDAVFRLGPGLKY